MSEPRFSVGDLVAHRASGVRALIVSVNHAPCRNPDHRIRDGVDAFTVNMGKVPHPCDAKPDACDRPFDGTYDVSLGFGSSGSLGDPSNPVVRIREVEVRRAVAGEAAAEEWWALLVCAGGLAEAAAVAEDVALRMDPHLGYAKQAIGSLVSFARRALEADARLNARREGDG